MGSYGSLVEVSVVLNDIATTLLKMATDLRFLSSGPRCGLGELVVPHDGLTSSIMPGKQNPTLVEMMSQIAFQVMDSHTTATMAGAVGGHFELNVAKPVIIYSILQSIDLLSDGIPDFARSLVAGLLANEKTLNRNVVLQVTALSPHIGYEKVSEIM
jgi:fumarate hydratase class II